MKLKIKKTFRLANPVVSKPHWHFTRDQILDTDNEYLIHRLLQIRCADIVDKNNTKKMPEPENKMVDTSKVENKQDEVKKVTPKKTLTTKKVKKVSAKKKGN